MKTNSHSQTKGLREEWEKELDLSLRDFFIDFMSNINQDNLLTDIPNNPDNIKIDLLLKKHSKHFKQFIESALKEAREEDFEKIMNLRADLAGAMGHMRGCGHTYEYLEKRYPELNPKQNK